MARALVGRVVMDGRPDHEVPDAHGGAEEDGEGVEAHLHPVAPAPGGRRERQQRPGGAGIEGEVGDVGEGREGLWPQPDLVDEPDEVAGQPAAEGHRQAPPGPLGGRVDAGPGRHPPGGDRGRQAESHRAEIADELAEAVAAEPGVGRADQQPGGEQHDQDRGREIAPHIAGQRHALYGT